MVKALYRIGKHSLDAFEAVMTAMGIYLTTNSIREVSSQENGARFSAKNLSLIAFFIFHMLALILAATTVGEFILSASLANLLVSFTSLANDLYELVTEWYVNNKRKNELRNKEQELSSFNINFEHNNLFIKEFVELKDEITVLTQQQEQCAILNSQLDDDACSNTIGLGTNLIKIAQMLQEKSDSILTEQTIINNYYESHGNVLDENKIIQEINVKAKLVKQRAKEIRLALLACIDAGLGNSEQAANYQENLDSLDYRIKRLDILSCHFYKVISSKIALKDIELRLDQLNDKYNQEPFVSYPDDEKHQIKMLERNYLLERRQALRDFISKPTQPIPSSARAAKLDIRKNAQIALEKLRTHHDKKTIQEVLDSFTASLQHVIDKKKAEFEQRKAFLNNIATDPHKQPKLDIDKILQAGKEIIELRSQIKLSSLEEKNKQWSTYISILSACVSILLTFFTHRIDAFVLDGLNKTFSIFGAVNSLWARAVNLHAKNDIDHEKQIENNKLAEDCAERAMLISDPNLRTDCVELIERFSQKLNQEYPIWAANDDRAGRSYLPRKSSPTNKSGKLSPKANKHTPKRMPFGA